MQTRSRLLLVGGVALLILAGLLTWWRSASPEALPLEDKVINASTPVNQPIYLGVFKTGTEFDRTLHLSGVKIHATSNTAVSLTPLLCRGGAITVTTQPDQFCPILINPEGQTLVAGDEIVLQVVSNEPAVAVVDHILLAFREGLQWAIVPAGAESVVQILPR